MTTSPQIIRAAEFTTPQITERKGTLLHAARVTEGIAWLEPRGLSTSTNCVTTGHVADFPCIEGYTPQEKTFEEVPWQDGLRFAVYAGVMCKGVGYDFSSAEGDLTRTFLANESNGVESALMEQRFAALPGSWDAATDITPTAGAVSPKVGMALLEGHASRFYAGQPTLHLPRTIGALLAGEEFVTEGDTYFTKQGAKVASGGGYENNLGPTGAAPAAGEYWLYASGEVAVARSEVISRTEMDRSTNEVLTLVERMYVASVDCYTAAVRVSIT